MWKSLTSKIERSLAQDFRYEISDEVACVFVKHYGSVTPAEIIARQGVIIEDSRHRPNLNRLVDMRGCRCNISAEDIAQIASTLHRRVERIGSFRQAMLLNDNLEHRSMRLLIASMSDFSVTYRTFLDTEQDLEQKVRAWLGLADDFEFPDFIKP